MSRMNKVVCFNRKDPYQLELHDFALEQELYFSRYIKRLIEQDMKSISTPVRRAVAVVEVKQSDDTDIMKDFF